MKLHLGCGQRYLNGYINIDFPLTEHSVQEKTVADLHADILKLQYPSGSIEEVRLHHVFEHFTRPVACALVAGWNSWLAPRGTLHIEVPDFYRTALAIISPLTSGSRKAVAERHLFGSHEAHWAAHYEGYTVASLSDLMNEFGFKVVQVKKNKWCGTYNFELIVQKTSDKYSLEESTGRAQNYLSKFLLDESEGELSLLDTWLDVYRKHVDLCWTNDR
ncbi:MAG: hypothetical protein V4632_04220 [Pseudomonadota bacterium]